MKDKLKQFFKEKKELLIFIGILSISMKICPVAAYGNGRTTAYTMKMQSISIPTAAITEKPTTTVTSV